MHVLIDENYQVILKAVAVAVVQTSFISMKSDLALSNVKYTVAHSFHYFEKLSGQ